MLEKVDEVNKINFFSKINSDKKPKNEGSVHDKIKLLRKNMKLDYEKDPYFSDIMPTINKQTKSKNMYQFLIRNGLKYNSPIIRLIYRTINELALKQQSPKSLNKEKEKKKNVYNLPHIDILKTLNKKIENNNIKKIKLIRLETKKFEEFKNNKFNIKRHLTTSKSQKNIIFNNISSISTKNTKNYEKDILSLSPTTNTNTNTNNNNILLLNTENHNNINNIKKSKINFNYLLNEKKNNSFIINNHNKSLDIINRCNKEVKDGHKVNIDVSNYKKEFEKSIHNKINSQDLLDLDHKVLEHQKKRINKYTRLEENNIKKIKKQLKEKISDNFAYENRKEFMEILKQDKNAKEYNLHLIEVDQYNKKMFRRINLERKRINKIKLMADDEFCRSIVIKKKMDEINQKNTRIKKMNSSQEIILPQKFLIPKVKNFGLKGDLVPSIINIRKYKIRDIRNSIKYLDKI